MRLAPSMEFILIACVGMAAARWYVTDPQMSGAYARTTWGLWSKDLIDSFLAGRSLAGCAGVWIERMRGRSPQPWGLGRWAWSVVGLHHLLANGITFTYRTYSSRKREPLTTVLGSLPDDFRVSLVFWLRNGPSYLLLAVVVTYLAAVPRPSSKADVREWTGRTLALLVIVTGIMNLFRIGVGF